MLTKFLVLYCHMQVECNNDELIVLYNGVDISSTVARASGYSTSLIQISRTSDNGTSTNASAPLTRVSVYFSNGVTIRIGVQLLIVDFELNLPQSFQGKTQGLLGTFNENPNDDYIYADGSGRVLNPDASDKEVHIWAQECKYGTVVLSCDTTRYRKTITDHI